MEHCSLSSPLCLDFVVPLIPQYSAHYMNELFCIELILTSGNACISACKEMMAFPFSSSPSHFPTGMCSKLACASSVVTSQPRPCGKPY